MKHPILILTAIAGFITSCQNNSALKDSMDSTVVTTEQTAVNNKECYVYIKNRDTVALTLNRSGNDLTGDLNYNLFEKDKNSGTIVGELKGDTILADYTFDAEGMRSVRQVAFLKKEGKLVEGFGDVEETNGKMAFKNTKSLKFDSIIVLEKTDCK